jgi:signal transduction histidine kinase
MTNVSRLIPLPGCKESYICQSRLPTNSYIIILMASTRRVESKSHWAGLQERIVDLVSSVPVRIKIIGIMVLPLLILGFVLNYWVRTGLSDWLSYLLTDERVQIAMEAGSRSVVLVTALAAVLSILLTFLLMLSLTQPLLELRQVAQNVAGGELTLRAHVRARDEIGEVAESVNQMIDHLVSSQQKLERTNRRLEAINRVALAAGRGSSMQDILDISLRTILSEMGFEIGWIYLHDAYHGDSQFSLSSVNSVTPELAVSLNNEAIGMCSCQKDLLADKLGTNAIARKCKRINFNALPEGSSDVHVTIPLSTRERKLGVISMLCSKERELTSTDLETLTTIGKQISEFISNAWLQASLREKEAARQLLLDALVRTQEDERAYLARELHDGAGQVLTSLSVRLKALEKLTPEGDLRDSVTSLCQATSETIARVSKLSHRLHPAVLEELGLEAALRTLVQEMLVGVELKFECQLDLDDRRLPSEIEISLYRIAQESLTNIVRHADAENVVVELRASHNLVSLHIEDDGKGFVSDNLGQKANQDRLGLISMRERAEMIGGSLTVQATPGSGTSINVRIPIQLEVTE